MKKIITFLLACLFVGILSASEKAKGFNEIDSMGQEQSLEAYKGKIVAIEFVNFKCPFVKKHYKSNNMQNLQKKYTSEGVIWLTVCSSAEGKQGYMTDDQINKALLDSGLGSTAYLVDSDGSMGKSYGAKTTPHMFIVDKEGSLAYRGAIDSVNSTKSSDIAGATNYVSKALDELLAGKAVSEPKTRPYGCSVKYAK